MKGFKGLVALVGLMALPLAAIGQKSSLTLTVTGMDAGSALGMSEAQDGRLLPMDTLYLDAKGTVKVTVASVYNILSQLADLRIYTRRLSANNKMYFDISTNRHVHLYDRENHRYRDVFDEELMDLVQSHLKRRKFKGFTVEDIDIQLIARPTRKARSV